MSRHQRSWEAFVHGALDYEAHGHFYSGVCFLDTRDRVGYADGWFKGEQHLPREQIAQFRGIFDELTRQTILLDPLTDPSSLILPERPTPLQSPSPAPGHRPRAHADPLSPSLVLGDTTFHVISATFTTICAVARGRRQSVIAERFAFGILVIRLAAPHSIEDVLPVVARRCAKLR